MGLDGKISNYIVITESSYDSVNFPKYLAN